MEFDRKKILEEMEKNFPKVRGTLIKGDKVIPITNENVIIVIGAVKGLEKEEGKEKEGEG